LIWGDAVTRKGVRGGEGGSRCANIKKACRGNKKTSAVHWKCRSVLGEKKKKKQMKNSVGGELAVRRGPL